MQNFLWENVWKSVRNYMVIEDILRYIKTKSQNRQMSHFSPICHFQLPISQKRPVWLVPCYIGVHHIFQWNCDDTHQWYLPVTAFLLPSAPARTSNSYSQTGWSLGLSLARQPIPVILWGNKRKGALYLIFINRVIFGAQLGMPTNTCIMMRGKGEQL